MKPITKQEFSATHTLAEIEDKRFSVLAARAVDLTEELCFGRTAKNEAEARRAMKEMIAFWIDHEDAESNDTVSERIGNYSATRDPDRAVTVHGVPVSPAALLILSRAGLRDHAV